MRMILPQTDRARSQSPPSLPHLRSPSPPPTGPYPSLATQHLSYTSFILDKSITRTFRSHQLDDLERGVSATIEAAAVMKKALGRLWQALSEDPDRQMVHTPQPTLIPKEEPDSENGDEDEDMDGEQARRIARAPDLTPSTHKIFLSEFHPELHSTLDPTQSLLGLTPEAEQDRMIKGLAALREVQDDGREFVERLEEIRDSLGDIRNKRNIVWDIIRRKALVEMKETSLARS